MRPAKRVKRKLRAVAPARLMTSSSRWGGRVSFSWVNVKVALDLDNQMNYVVVTAAELDLLVAVGRHQVEGAGGPGIGLPICSGLCRPNVR